MAYWQMIINQTFSFGIEKSYTCCLFSLVMESPSLIVFVSTARTQVYLVVMHSELDSKNGGGGPGKLSVRDSRKGWHLRVTKSP